MVYCVKASIFTASRNMYMSSRWTKVTGYSTVTPFTAAFMLVLPIVNMKLAKTISSFDRCILGCQAFDLVLIQTLLPFESRLFFYHANKILVSIPKWSLSASLQIEGLATKYTNINWAINPRIGRGIYAHLE